MMAFFSIKIVLQLSGRISDPHAGHADAMGRSQSCTVVHLRDPRAVIVHQDTKLSCAWFNL